MFKKIRGWLEAERNFLYAALGFAFLLRLAFVLKTGTGGLSPDAGDWMSSGWAIAAGSGFGNSWRPPGYAFYLAGVFSVFGKSIMAAKVLNAVLGTATVLFTYLTAKALLNPGTARIAAALTSFYPYLIAYTGDLISETFLAFIISAAVLAVVKTAQNAAWKNLALTGVLIGCAGLTKSVVLPFFLLACGWLWWQTGRFRTGFLVGVFTLLTIAPWTLRNYFHYDKGYVMPVSTPWFSLYGSACDEALLNETTGDLLKGPGQKSVDQFLPPDWAAVAALPLPERDKYCKEKALGWIKDNPDKFTWLLYKRFIHFWRLYPVIAYGWEKAAAMATSGLYIPLAAIGFFLALPAFKKTSLLLALFASYTAVHLFFVVTLRYRVPIDPYVIMLAAYALSEGYGRLLRRPA